MMCVARAATESRFQLITELWQLITYIWSVVDDYWFRVVETIAADVWNGGAWRVARTQTNFVPHSKSVSFTIYKRQSVFTDHNNLDSPSNKNNK